MTNVGWSTYGVVFLAAVLLLSIAAAIPLLPRAEATFPGENGRIAFSLDGNIFSMDPDGSDVVQLTTGFTNAQSPSWSPDGTKIAFTNFDDPDWDIYIMNADGTGLTKLIDNDRDEGYPTWSPDGTKIAFDSHGLVYVIDADGTDETLLPIRTDSTTYPNWSPDGTKIALIDDGVVAVMNSDGSGFTDITDCSVCDASFPNWSPDGTKIAFQSGAQTTYVVNPDGTGLTALEDNARRPAWSPDGTKITFSNENGIHVMNSDGANPVSLGVSGGGPDWGIQSTMQQSVLTVDAISLSGSPLHMWTEIQPSGGSTETGFTPLSKEASSGTSFTVTVHDYQDIVFDHWEDGSTERTRTVELGDDTTITAFYNTGNSVKGFTPLTYTGTEEEPDLTVEALSLADGHALHMWTRIVAEETSESGTTYMVTVHDYLDRQFDHWEDGSTERTRTLTIAEDTTITAYYNTA